MSWKISKGCLWIWCVAGLVAQTPVIEAQAPKTATVVQVLPPLVGFPSGFSVYQQAGDVLERPVTLESQAGDDFLLSLAAAGDINLICVVPSPLPDVRTLPDRKILMPLLELARDGKLSWYRASKKTFVFWPQPDEEALGQSWLQWLQEQFAEDAALEATNSAEEAEALKQLRINDTPAARQQLRQAYVAFVRARQQRQVQEQVRKYFEDHPQVTDAPEQVGPFRGRVSVLSNFPAPLQKQIGMIARTSLRDRWSPSDNLWFSPQHADFWKKARLCVVAEDDAEKTPWLELKSGDKNGPYKDAQFKVGHYLPRVIPPAPQISPYQDPAPRPNTGIRLVAKQMLLSEVLTEISKQSGLTIEAPLERLSKTRLTLSVQGMEPQEFLESLARALLIEWKVEGQRVTAQERNDSPSDRFFLQLGNISLYHALTLNGVDDYREEEELARAIYDEVGNEILSPEGVALSELSPEVQEGVRLEAQELLLRPLLFEFGSLLPVSLEQSKIVMSLTTPQPVRLWVDEHQVQEIIPANVQGEEAHTATVVNARTLGQDKVADLVQAYQSARQKQTEQRRRIEQNIQARAARAEK